MVSTLSKKINDHYDKSEKTNKEFKKGNLSTDEFLESFLADRKAYHTLEIQKKLLQ